MRAFALLVLGTLLLAGCGSDGGDGDPATSRVPDGNYEVGKDLEAGVYTAALGCIGTIASVAGYEAGSSDPDPFLGAAVRVGTSSRVALKAGEFFTSQECPEGWQRESETGPRLPDPATVKGACVILVGNGLVDEALSIARNPAEFESRRANEVQEELFTIVVSRTPQLLAAAGELVDLLDDPAGYGDPSPFTTRIDRAVAKIRRVCG